MEIYKIRFSPLSEIFSVQFSFYEKEIPVFYALQLLYISFYCDRVESSIKNYSLNLTKGVGLYSSIILL